MAKLELFYPVKPLKINQAFGIQNLTYTRFGFTKHNGIDYALSEDKIARAMCDGVVYETGFNEGAGNFVRYRTLLPVEAEGHTAYVAFMYMHAERVLVRAGQKVAAGDPLMICDSTGFSTGNHLHISAYHINGQNGKEAWNDAKSDYCFDFSKYYNKYFAVDAPKVFQIYYQMLAALRSWLNK